MSCKSLCTLIVLYTYITFCLTQWHRGWVGRGHMLPILASEIQNIFGNFKTLYQLRMCVMTSCDLNVNTRRKNIKLCPPLSPYLRRPWSHFSFLTVTIDPSISFLSYLMEDFFVPLYLALFFIFLCSSFLLCFLFCFVFRILLFNCCFIFHFSLLLHYLFCSSLFALFFTICFVLHYLLYSSLFALFFISFS